jgi:hypothetical protein
MSTFDVLAEGAGPVDTVTEFVRDHALAFAVCTGVLVILVVVMIYKHHSEGLANPTASLKMMQRSDYGAREGMSSKTDNAADQSLVQNSVDSTAGDSDMSAASCGAALADKSVDDPYAWMQTTVQNSGSEAMVSRPKNDNDFSKVLMGH